MAAPFATHPERNVPPSADIDVQASDWAESAPGAAPHADTCHVWKVDLHGLCVDALQACVLDVGEQQRLSGFSRPEDAVRFAGARAALRTILAGYLNCAPQKIVFQTGAHGRPSLSMGSLDFSVSHSSSLALLAICGGAAVGIDVEAFREVKDVLALSQRFFQPDEQSHLNSLAAADRSHAFLTCWTRKESVMKCTGLGMALGISQVHAGAGPGAQLVDLPAVAGSGQVRVVSIAPADGYVGACATPLRVERLEFRRFRFADGQADVA